MPPKRIKTPVDIPPIVIPNMDPAMAAMFAMMQQNQAAQLKAMRNDMDRRFNHGTPVGNANSVGAVVDSPPGGWLG